ncbi:hypothetical protein JCM10213_004343 [Rhodosporidiobolus nylandii]
MATSGTPAIDASTRLLRVASHLLLEVDPVKGGKAKALGLVVDELKDLLDHETLRLPAAVQSLLCSAITSLSSDIPTIPYPDCLYALSAISSALPLLVSPFSPRPSPFSYLPAELVARIVDFCQDEDFRLRQNTNLALSYACRGLHRVVQPILRTEMHLYTTGQLERAMEKAQRTPIKALQVRELTADLSLPEIARQPDGRWAGRHLPRLISVLSQTKALRKLRINFRPSDPASDSEAGEDPGDEVLFAVGLDVGEWEGLFSPRKEMRRVEDLSLPALDKTDTCVPFVRTLFGPSSRLQHLRIGNASHPHTVDEDDLTDMQQQYEKSFEGRGGPLKVYASLRTLALPYFAFQTAKFLPFTLPQNLEHVEVTLLLEDTLRVEVVRLSDLFTQLAPSIRHLVLRVKREGCSAAEAETICNVLQSGLRSCTKLRHLELGGHIIAASFLEEVGLLHPARTFVLLPHSTEHFEPEKAAESMKGIWRLEAVTTFRVEVREAEYKWLDEA